MIKHVRLGRVELVRRVYFGVRTDDWDTIYPAFSDLEIDATGETFRATWTARCEGGPVDYRWTGTIEAGADGTIRFTAAGEPMADFASNRIGLCLLLPAQTLAGLPFTLIKPDGREEAGTFARYVYPRLLGSQFRGIRYKPPAGVVVQCDMDGAIFDMEDQRLYMDTTYKAYASLPHDYPRVRAGEAFTQTWTMRLPDGPGSVQSIDAGEPVTVRLGDPIDGGRLPGLGLTLTNTDPKHPLTEQEVADLAAMELAHLRIEVDLNDAACQARVADALPLVGNITPGLLISAQNVGESTLDRLISIVRRVEVSPIDVLLIEACDADPGHLPAIREAVQSNRMKVLVGGPGSADVSGHPDLPAWADAKPDFLAWAASPAIHQEDDETLMENAAGITEQLAAVRRYAGKLPLAMGPFRLDGAWPRPRPSPRHTGLFAAAWAAAAVKHLGEAGAAFATLFRTTGAAGVLYRPESFPQPGFDDTRRRRYPVYNCLAWLSRTRGILCRATTSHPLRVEALAVRPDNRAAGPDRHAGEPILLLVNKTFRPQSVRVQGISRRRNIYIFTGTASDPGNLWARGQHTATYAHNQPSPSALTVPPYALMWLTPDG